MMICVWLNAVMFFMIFYDLLFYCCAKALNWLLNIIIIVKNAMFKECIGFGKKVV